MKPRILFIAPSAYVLGGLATWLDYLEPGLRGRGWDVTIGLVEGPRHHCADCYITEHSHGQWIPIPCRTGTPEGRWRAVVRAIEKLRPDIVATVNIPDAIVAVARLRAQGKPAPRVVMTNHGIQSDLYDDMRAYCNTLDAVVSTNMLAMHLTAARGQITSERSLYAPCGTPFPPRRKGDGPEVLPHPNPLPEGEGNTARPLVIAWVGRLEQEQKRIHDLLPILTRLQQRQVPFECLIAGDGPEQAALERELADFRSRGRVCILGRLNAQQLAEQVYRRADSFLLTSVWETGPIVAWEAMSYAVPAVSSRYVGSGAEAALIDGENALLFPIGDAACAAEQLERLCRDPGLRDRMGASARETVRERYTIEKSVEQWNAAFRRVLELPPLPSAAVTSLPPRGRLDRWIGTGRAETVRSLLGRSCRAEEPGGEWPHSHHARPNDDPEFWNLARQLDQEAVAVIC